MEAGKVRLADKGDLKLDLVDAMVSAANPEETDADADRLDAELSAGPELQVRGAGEIVAAVLVAPVVGRILPGNADPA